MADLDRHILGDLQPPFMHVVFLYSPSLRFAVAEITGHLFLSFGKNIECPASDSREDWEGYGFVTVTSNGSPQKVHFITKLIET